MNTRLPQNKNLSLHFDPTWHGLPVNVYKGPLISEYLFAIDHVLWSATDDHLRTLVIRFDLHYPASRAFDTEGHISRFLASLKAQIKADMAARERGGKRVHRCTLRHVWAREQNGSDNPHYHVAILLNYDTYRAVGAFDGERGLASMIRNAWVRVLGLTLEQSAGLVHFGSQYKLDVNGADFSAVYDEVFFALSYLAKAYSKNYDQSGNCFGHSQCLGRAAPGLRNKNLRRPAIA